MNYLDFVKKYAVLPALFISGFLEANHMGLIGGESGGVGSGPAYAALISHDGVATPLTLPGIALSSTVLSAQSNQSTKGLLGGRSFSTLAAYAATVSSTGNVSPLTGLPSAGRINSVALNSSGQGLIGGQEDTLVDGFAALVSPGEVVTPINLLLSGTGNILSVALNNSGLGLVGGADSGTAYAALISPGGTATVLSLPPGPPGSIVSVALSDSGQGLIGGDEPSGGAYAATVSSGGVVSALTGLALPSPGLINSVAINGSSQGLIGGLDFNGALPAFAALVSPAGVASSLTGTPLPSTGFINSVAINNSAQGLIGGVNGTAAYAAYVSLSGFVTPLSLGIPSGSINSVALNEFSQGIIGGKNGTAPYAALVLPTGQIINIDLGLSTGVINSVSLLIAEIPISPISPISPNIGGPLSGNNLVFANYINNKAPDRVFYFIPSVLDGTLNQALASAAPTRNAFSLFTADNAAFYIDTLLSNHNRNARNARRQARHTGLQTHKKTAQAGSSLGTPSDELLAEAASTLDIPSEELLAWSAPKNKPASSSRVASKEHPFELWGTFLGALAYQKKQHQTPAFNPTTGGIILGFDGKVSTHTRVGTGAAYTYTYIHEKQDAGHSRINQEYLFLYTTWDNTHWYFDTALMAGWFQIHNVRKIHMTGFEFQSESKPKGWQLAPHLEVGYDYNFYDRKFTAEPFVMFDWINNWQGSYKEHGSGPFNAGQKRHYSSFLRSETGLRFYETIRYDSWNFTVQEKLSYVNKKPFQVGRVNAFLVGAPGSFTVETLTTTQNLGVAEIEFIFQPHKCSLPRTTLEYQGEFGTMYQSHIVSLELAWSF